MARRLPKFPLKMANGTGVRNIEDLRANADIDSIVTYFLSGQLNLWCRAFGYDNLPDKFESVTCKLIKSIYDVLEIPVQISEIEAYVKENGIHVSNKSISNAEIEEEVIDNEEVKNKLKSYVDSDVSLSDYSIEVIPVSSELKMVSVSNKKTRYCKNFVFKCDAGQDCQSEKIPVSLYKKIADALNKQINNKSII